MTHTSFGDPQHERLRDILSQHADLEGPLLPILHAVQTAFEHIPDDAIAIIADHLNIGRAEVHGVVSFYHDFRQRPAGRHVIKICRAEACQAVGVNVLAQTTLDKLGLDWHGTTENGALTIEPVFCLGLCACAPAAMVDGQVVGRLDQDKLDQIVAETGA
ncbi:MAG: formate dehydrogenase subunit gamma [Thalassovita sp.]